MMPTSVSGFGQYGEQRYDLAVGSLLGTRRWTEYQGHLYGLTFSGYEWKPGVNVSACPYHEIEGRCGIPECGCGFWAFYNGDQYPVGEVLGVIEGFGKTTIGTRGFRCEKARIVALYVREPTLWRDYFPVPQFVAVVSILEIAIGLVNPMALIALLGPAVGCIQMARYARKLERRRAEARARRKRLQKTYPGVTFYRSQRALNRDYSARKLRQQAVGHG